MDSTEIRRQGCGRALQPPEVHCGINLMNLNNVTLENVVVVNVPAFHVRLSNVGRVSVSGCVLQSAGFNTDGLHFNGPANDITISNCKFTTGDDSIALNCPEGYAGDISRVSVTGCTFNSLSLMRLYTADGIRKFNINTVSVSNCIGEFTAAAFLIGLIQGSNPNSVDGLTISNCKLTASTVLGIAENFGAIVLNNVTFNPSQQNALWFPPQVNQTCGFLRPSPFYGDVPFVGSSLTFENCIIYRQSHVAVEPLMLENNSMIANVSFNGFAVQGPQGTNPMIPTLLEIDSGSIGQLVMTNLNASEIQTPISANQFSNIGSVSGAGVLATGWEFPNGVMANDVPYISANSGAPSIKIEGVVESYPVP